MAAAIRPAVPSRGFAGGVQEGLRDQWSALGRRAEDFDLLWDLYWAELGPLAPVPIDVHQLDEVLTR